MKLNSIIRMGLSAFAVFCVSELSQAAIHMAIPVILKPIYSSPDLGTVDPDPKGQRTPPAPVACTISPEYGVTIHSQSISQIISYEIRDAEGTGSIAVLADEQSFTDILYTMEGEYQLRFTTCDQTLAGSIFLENY